MRPALFDEPIVNRSMNTPPVVLVPVLELDPFQYAAEDRVTPDAACDPRSRRQHWLDSLQDAGITGLTPWPDTRLVPVEQLVETSTLRAILRVEFADVTVDDALEELGALSGGFVLSHTHGAILPSCCGDLGNLAEWQMAADHVAADWKDVWIGHPWTHVRSEGETLVFTEPRESHATEELVEVARMPRHDLQTAIATAARQLDAFGARLAPLVDEFRFDVSTERIVDMLVRGRR